MRMWKIIQNRIWKSRAGISLMELLVSVLITSMALTGIAACITSAIRVYRRTTLRADAEMLLGTTVTVLSNDLRTAAKHKLSAAEEKQRMEIFCEEQKMYLLFENDGEKGIRVTADTRSASERGEDDPTAVYPIVSSKTKTEGLYNEVQWTGASDGLFQFTVSVKSTESDTAALASQTVSVQSMVTQSPD